MEVCGARASGTKFNGMPETSVITINILIKARLTLLIFTFASGSSMAYMTLLLILSLLEVLVFCSSWIFALILIFKVLH